MNITSNHDTQVNSPEELFKQYYSRLCDFARKFLNDGDEAEDLVQDAFVVFLEQKDRIGKHPLAIKSFLYTTINNACLNKLRHTKVKNRYNEQNQTEAVDDKQMLESIIHAEIIGEIYAAIQSLPPGCAMVLKLGYLDGLKNHQITKELGISINTVKSQKQRGLMLLREKLSPQAMAIILSVLLPT